VAAPLVRRFGSAGGADEGRGAERTGAFATTTELLLEAAEHSGSIEAATEQFELALFLDARYMRQ
jgi:hypothetical protein